MRPWFSIPFQFSSAIIAARTEKGYCKDLSDSPRPSRERSGVLQIPLRQLSDAALIHPLIATLFASFQGNSILFRRNGFLVFPLSCSLRRSCLEALWAGCWY